MNGYYGFEPCHQHHAQPLILPAAPVSPPNGHYLLGPTQQSLVSKRKREHPDVHANGTPGSGGEGLTNGFSTADCSCSHCDLDRVAHHEHDHGPKPKRACLQGQRMCVVSPQAQVPSLSAGYGPMDCSSHMHQVPNDRSTLNGFHNGGWLAHLPSGPQEADIIDMNPVEPGPVVTGHAAVVKMKTRRAQLCMMDELCSCAQTLGISVLECPKCLAGQPGHLMHILDNQRMETC